VSGGEACSRKDACYPWRSAPPSGNAYESCDEESGNDYLEHHNTSVSLNSSGQRCATAGWCTALLAAVGLASYGPSPLCTRVRESTNGQHGLYLFVLGRCDFAGHSEPLKLVLPLSPPEKAIEELRGTMPEPMRGSHQNVHKMNVTRMQPELEDADNLPTVPSQEVLIRLSIRAAEVATIRTQCPSQVVLVGQRHDRPFV